MSEFVCANCGFATDDPSLPECPSCSGYLREREEEVALDDLRTTEEIYY